MNESPLFGRGPAEVSRDSILRVLRARFPGVDLGDIAAALQRIPYSDQLAPYLELAVSCTGIDDFRNKAWPVGPVRR